MQYDNTNSGVLFKNDRKETDKHPDYKGSINIDGTEYWLSGWKKQSKDGTPRLSLSVKAKDAKAAPAPKASDTPFDDPLPFAWLVAIPVGLLLAVGGAANWVA